MRNLTCLSLLGTLLLPGVVRAQDVRESEDVPRIIRLETSDRKIARWVLDTFKTESRRVARGGEQSWLVEIDRDGNGAMAGRDAPARHYLEVMAKPPLMMKHYAKQVQAFRMQFSMLAGMALSMQGVDAKQAKRLIDAVFDFPNIVSAVVLTITDEPKAGGSTTIMLDLVPAADSAFKKYTEKLVTNQSGAPVLGNQRSSLRFAVSLAPEAIRPVLAPFMPFVTELGSKSPADAEARRAYYERVLGAWDGTMGGALRLGRKATFESAVGLSEPAAYAKLFTDDALLAQTKRIAEASPTAQVTLQKNALQHREVSVLRTDTTTAGPAGSENPLADEEGTMVSMSGVAGDYAVTLLGRGATADAMKESVDRALDGKIERKPLDEDALFWAELEIKRLMRALPGPTQLPLIPIGKEGPNTATISVRRIGLTWKIRIDLE